MNSKNGHHNRIGLVLSSAPGYSETFFLNKIKVLQSNGFEVILFVNASSGSNRDDSYKVVPAFNFEGSVVSLFKNTIKVILSTIFIHPIQSYTLFKLDRRDGGSIYRCIKNQFINECMLSYKLDWLHFGFGMLAYQRENVATAIGARMAVSFRGFDLYLSPLKHPGCYRHLFTKKARYHVLSDDMKQDLHAHGIALQDIHRITPAIDTKFFMNSEQTSFNTSKTLQLVTIGRLHWKKGFEYTLEALALLKSQGIDFKYTIIGAGEEKERLVFGAHQLGLSDKVHFAGKLSPVAVRAQLEQSDVYLQYSIQEGFCNAVLEAQAMGLLCIVSNAEGLDENVLDGSTGWVVPKRQPRLLADKIMEVINLSELEKITIRNTAINRVRQEFDVQGQNEKFREFYSNNEL